MKEVQKAEMAQSDLLAIYQALDRVQAMIEFDLEGTVVSANENFLRIFGYELDEVVGKHHRMFCDPVYVESDEYADFWKNHRIQPQLKINLYPKNLLGLRLKRALTACVPYCYTPSHLICMYIDMDNN